MKIFGLSIKRFYLKNPKLLKTPNFLTKKPLFYYIFKKYLSISFPRYALFWLSARAKQKSFSRYTLRVNLWILMKIPSRMSRRYRPRVFTRAFRWKTSPLQGTKGLGLFALWHRRKDRRAVYITAFTNDQTVTFAILFVLFCSHRKVHIPFSFKKKKLRKKSNIKK